MRAPETSAGNRTSLAAILGLVVAATLAYASSFHGVFLLDDHRSLVDNVTIRQLWPPGVPLSPPLSCTLSGRPVANATFAINRTLHGLDVRGYHAVNLCIHLAAGLTLFGLVRRTLLLPRLQPRFGKSAIPFSFSIAALWLLHPLQTESVTYLVQRVESLMGLFYLLTLYGYVRAAGASGVTAEATDGMPVPERRRWITLSVAACFLGMGTKEVMVSAPLIALLFDRAFVSGSFAEAFRRHKQLLTGLAASWILLAALVISTGGNRGGSVGFGTGISLWDYWLTQPRAIATYLKLSAWPNPLVFEYGTNWLGSAWEAVPYAALVLPLAIGSLIALWRWPIAGFLGTWFFSILAPTSLMPGISQTTVEHRMYLALVAFVIAIVGVTHLAIGRRASTLWLVVAVGFGLVTAQRNILYGDATRIWTDTIAKRPNNPLAHDNLGRTLQAAGRLEEAIKHHQIASDLSPQNAGLHYNLGTALLDAQRNPEALKHLALAAQLAPENADAHNNLSIVLAALGRTEESVREAAFGVRQEPNNASFRYNLATALLRLGQPADAAEQFRTSVRLNPQYVDAHNDLGSALVQLGDLAGAAQAFQAALKLSPNDVQAHHNLGTTFAMMGRMQDARAEFEAALKIQPDYTVAQLSLADVWMELGRPDQAVPLYEVGLRAQPASAESARACMNLGHAYERLGDTARAVAAYQAALRADPEISAAREQLARLRR